MDLSENRHSIHNQIYRWLARRDHSILEVFEKCLQKGYPENEIHSALEVFQKKGFLDDKRFAELFVADKFNIYNWGPLKIHKELAQKGVKKQYINDALEKIIPESSLDKALVSAVKKARRQLMRTEAGLKRKKRLVDFLVRKGFPWHLVMENSDELLRVLENEEF